MRDRRKRWDAEGKRALGAVEALDMTNKIALNILHYTDDYRGDHAADVAIAVEQRTELVTELVQRLNLKPKDRIEIRVIETREGSDA